MSLLRSLSNPIMNHEHVEGYLATTRPPHNTEEAVCSGFLGSPLLGTRTRVAADWCHAWSLLGQWSGWVTFPVPEADVWPRHGHLRGILDGYTGRQPNFHKWARPAYEQGALPTLSLLPGDVTIRVLPGDKIYQAMEIEPEFMRPAISHGFGTSAKKRLPVRLAELAQYGWMPLAAALFGTVKWQPQWLHHNFLPVIGLRVHAKVPPPSLTDRQLVALLGLWERGEHRGLQCRALEQAAQLDFGLPTVFDALGTWRTEIKGYTFDIVHCAQQIYTGTAPSDSQALLDRPRKWAQWVFSLEEVRQEDVPMQDRPLMVHCSGLGGGLLSPDHDYDLFFQNHAQMKVDGPSLAMIDDWEQRVTQLGLTKTTHEYAVYQLLATAIGWRVWRKFLPAAYADHKLLLTRAVRLLTAATIRPRMHDHRIQLGLQQSDRSFGVTTPKAKFSYCERVSLTWCRCRFRKVVGKLISWVFRPGPIPGWQSMKYSMSLHAFRVPLRLLLLRPHLKCCDWPQGNAE